MRELLTLAVLSGAFTGTFTGATTAQPVATNCVETLFAANNGGDMGGAVYFDITVTQSISFSGVLMNTTERPPVGLTVFTTRGTYVGQENNMAPGAYGMALMADNFSTGVQVGHDTTNGNGANQSYISTDTIVVLSLGAATNVPFTGNIFNPRVWNGRPCSGLPGRSA